MNSNTNPPLAISIENVCLWLGDVSLFQNLSWSIPANAWTCLMGQSGIGKTTLLKLIAGLLGKDSRLQGKVSQLAPLAYLGQEDALLPWLTVFENAALSARLGPYSRAEKNIIRERAAHLLQSVGLENVAHQYPQTLSGGMRQRVALARALAEDKTIILLDEPFSRLDAITRHQLQDLAANLLKNKTVVLVTHDPQEALRLGDRIDLLAARPASIETFAHFSYSGPRELSSPELLSLQKKLYQALSSQHQEGQHIHALADSLNLEAASA